MCVVCDDGFTFVDRCGDRVWHVGRVPQPIETAGVSHTLDAGHKGQNLNWQAKDFFKSGFPKGRSFGKIAHVVERKNIKLVQRIEGSGGGKVTILHSCKEFFGAAV